MSEILGTLFKYLAQIMGVGAILGIAYVAFGSNKSSNAITDLNQLTTSVQALYASQNSFASLTSTVAVNGKLAPQRMISGTSLVNPWNGANTIAADTNPTLFDVTMAGVPADGCNKLATSTTPVALTINAAAVTLPVDAGAAVTACSSATSNTLVFTFGR